MCIIAALLFVLAFITNRRFGILGLALFAGSYLGHTWTGATMPLIEKAGLNLSSLGVTPTVMITAVFTILPSVILLANSPKYHGRRAKFFGSLGYSLLAVVLLLPLFDDPFLSPEQAQMTVSFVKQNYALLVTIGLVGAIVDLFLSRSKKHHNEKKHANS